MAKPLWVRHLCEPSANTDSFNPHNGLLRFHHHRKIPQPASHFTEEETEGSRVQITPRVALLGGEEARISTQAVPALTHRTSNSLQLVFIWGTQEPALPSMHPETDPTQTFRKGIILC